MSQPCDVQDEGCTHLADNKSVCSSCLRHVCPECSQGLTQIKDDYGHTYFVPVALSPSTPVVTACPACAHLELVKAMHHAARAHAVAFEHVAEHLGYNVQDLRQYDDVNDYHDALHYQDVGKTGQGLPFPTNHVYDNQEYDDDEGVTAQLHNIRDTLSDVKNTLVHHYMPGATNTQKRTGVAAAIGAFGVLSGAAPLGLAAAAIAWGAGRRRSPGDATHKSGPLVNPNNPALPGPKHNAERVDFMDPKLDLDTLPSFKLPGHNAPPARDTVSGLLNPMNWHIRGMGTEEIDHPFLKNDDGTAKRMRVPTGNSRRDADVKQLAAAPRHTTDELMAGLDRAAREDKGAAFYDHLNTLERGAVHHAVSSMRRDPKKVSGGGSTYVRGQASTGGKFDSDNLGKQLSAGKLYGVYNQADDMGNRLTPDSILDSIGVGPEKRGPDTVDPTTGLAVPGKVTYAGHEAINNIINSPSTLEAQQESFRSAKEQARRAFGAKLYGTKKVEDWEMTPRSVYVDEYGKTVHHNSAGARRKYTRNDPILFAGKGFSNLPEMAKSLKLAPPDETETLPTPPPAMKKIKPTTPKKKKPVTKKPTKPTKPIP